MYLMVDCWVVFNQPFLWEQPGKSKEVYIYLNNKKSRIKINKKQKTSLKVLECFQGSEEFQGQELGEGTAEK